MDMKNIRTVIPALLLMMGFNLYAISEEPVIPKLNDLSGLEALKDAFNKDTGKNRLLLLLSPT